MQVPESLKRNILPDNLPLAVPAAANPLPAKVVSLHVRPFFASHLCFETDGILDHLNLALNPKAVGLLGATVPAFDFNLFYAILGSKPTLPATGSITFTTNPAVNSTIVLNGTTWTFVSSLTTGNQLLISSTLALTLTSAVKTLQASTDANTKKFLYAASSSVLILIAATGGSGGNALTISTTVSGVTVSNSTGSQNEPEQGGSLSGGDPSRLAYGFLKIQAEVAPFTLATLRAEPRKAALEKAINTRQNAYLAKYAQQDTIISFAKQYYFNPPDFGLNQPANPSSKSARLDNLSDVNESRWAALNGAYANVGRQDGSAGVVDEVISKVSSDTAGYGYEANSGVEETAIVAPANSTFDPLGATRPEPPPSPWSALDLTQGVSQQQLRVGRPPDASTLWATGSDNWLGGREPQTSTTGGVTSSYQTNSNANQAHQDQVVTTSGQAFRHPFYDAKAQYQRAQISLIDQQFSALQSAQTIPNLATIFGNELASIDADVYRLQIAYLNTILMSPIDGIVTGVYKNPGDPVRAGEPVIRVENFAVIQMEAIVIFRGPILVNQTTVTITTALFGSSSGQPTSISGLVVAARIHSDDDTWHLIVECANRDGSTPPQPIFPPGYRFDPDDTTVTIG